MNTVELLLNQAIESDGLLKKDVWVASDVGLKPDGTHSIYYLNFSKISTKWLKNVAMRRKNLLILGCFHHFTMPQ